MSANRFDLAGVAVKSEKVVQKKKQSLSIKAIQRCNKNINLASNLILYPELSASLPNYLTVLADVRTRAQMLLFFCSGR